MKINTDTDKLVMDDGTIYYANNCIVGLGWDGQIYGGFDQRLASFMEDDIPPHHRREIAIYMRDLWAKIAEEPL